MNMENHTNTKINRGRKNMREPAQIIPLTDSVDDITERMLVDAGIGPGMPFSGATTRMRASPG
jgi:hypothetical protein